MNVTNIHNLPSSIVAAVRNDPYPHGKTGDISATQLISPPQLAALKWLHNDRLEEDASERIWALLGQAVHSVLERADPDAETEKRLFAEANGWIISGAADRIRKLDEAGSAHAIEDYKITSVWAIKAGTKQEWIDQLHILQWLGLQNGYNPERLSIVAILRDWSKHQPKRDREYPQQPSIEVEVEPLPAPALRGWVSERVALHQEARAAAQRGSALPECTDAERWAKPTVYAVRKPGRKSAVKLHDTKEAAEQHAQEFKGGYVEVRPGENTRCEHYCPVRDFCRQHAATLGEAGDQQDAA